MLDAQEIIDDFVVPTLQQQLEWAYRDIPKEAPQEPAAPIWKSDPPYAVQESALTATSSGEQLYGVNKDYYIKAPQQQQGAIRLAYLTQESQLAMDVWLASKKADTDTEYLLTQS
jgi:hypothetical protein